MIWGEKTPLFLEGHPYLEDPGISPFTSKKSPPSPDLDQVDAVTLPKAVPKTAKTFEGGPRQQFVFVGSHNSTETGVK